MAFTVTVAGVDRTTSVVYGSVTLKRNTLDFALLDPVTTNLLSANTSSMETDVSGWANAYHASLAQSAAQFLDGTHSMAITNITAPDSAFASTPTGASGVAVTPGNTYTASAYFRAAATPNPVECYINWYQAGGAASAVRAQDVAATVTDTTSGWTRSTITATAPSDAAFAAIGLGITAVSGLGEVHYADLVAFGSQAIPALGDSLVTTDPAWTGAVAGVTTSDPVDLRNGHVQVAVTGTNTQTLTASTAPFDLSDVPSSSTPFDYLLEDGTGHYLLESGTDFATASSSLMLEGALAYGYSGLSVTKYAGTPPTTLGRCTVQQPGLRPGNTVHVTSLNQGLSSVAYQVSQTTIRWHGANPASPVYAIEFGDTPQTLAAWTLANTVTTVSQTAPPVTIPSGPVTFGSFQVTPGIYAAGGGTVTIGSATFSVSVPIGHTLTVQFQGAVDARMEAWDNFVATPRRGVRGVISGAIYTGAWQELPFGITRAVYDLSSAPGIALAAGTYTVSIQINTVEANQMHVYGGWALASVTTV